MNLSKKTIMGLVASLVIGIFPLTCNSDAKDAKRVILNDSNSISLYGEINGQTAAETIQALRKLDSGSSFLAKKDPIYLFLYSPGGDIQAGLEIIEAAHGLNRPVKTITLFAASMAFQLAQNLDERLALKNSVYMSHRAAGSFQGYFGGKSPSQLDSRYGFWLQRLKELDEQTVRRTNGKQTMESYRDEYKDEMWLSGSQAVEQGYADKVVYVHCDKSLDGTTAHQAEFMGLQITYEISKCPMITSILNVKISSPDGKVITVGTLDEIKSKFVEQYDFEKTVK